MRNPRIWMIAMLFLALGVLAPFRFTLLDASSWRAVIPVILSATIPFCDLPRSWGISQSYTPRPSFEISPVTPGSSLPLLTEVNQLFAMLVLTTTDYGTSIPLLSSIARLANETLPMLESGAPEESFVVNELAIAASETMSSFISLYRHVGSHARWIVIVQQRFQWGLQTAMWVASMIPAASSAQTVALRDFVILARVALVDTVVDLQNDLLNLHKPFRRVAQCLARLRALVGPVGCSNLQSPSGDTSIVSRSGVCQQIMQIIAHGALLRDNMDSLDNFHDFLHNAHAHIAAHNMQASVFSDHIVLAIVELEIGITRLQALMHTMRV